MKYLLLILFIPIGCFASVDVAFLELRTKEGQLIQLESNGQFAHIAISYQRRWLHSHPYRGVEIVSRETLEEMGTIKAIVTIPGLRSLTKANIENFLGKPYDHEFSWQNDKIYCSELVAKLLNIRPKPMSFESTVWNQRLQSTHGQLGLSPDDLFQYFKEKGYRLKNISNKCLKIFI